MKKQIPERWLDYQSIGRVIANSSFIAFKVPLHKRICESLPEPERHTTSDVITAIPRLGIVINLTNTQNDTKYYQPHDWERHGVEYKWIKTGGHVTPSQSLLIEFCRTVKTFLTKNPQKLVGVHCTHGLNRTGYFVCSYMVLCNNVSPSDAMRNFSVARGHPIERPNYINAIMHHRSNQELKHRITNVRQSRWGCDVGPELRQPERSDILSQMPERRSANAHGCVLEPQARATWDGRSGHNNTARRITSRDNSRHRPERIANVSQYRERSNGSVNFSQVPERSGSSIQGAVNNVRIENSSQRQGRSTSSSVNQHDRSNSNSRWNQRNPRSNVVGSSNPGWSDWVNKRMNK